MEQKKIIILATDCDTTQILYNSLRTDFEIERVVLEESVSKKLLIKRRIKKLGIINVGGQLLFLILILPFLKWSSKKRKAAIAASYNLNFDPVPEKKITRISSVNDSTCKDILQKISPDLVIINGTRIIGEKTLNSISAPFINIHAGITPQFRGVHGGYWAIATGNKEFFGTTIHRVDTGIDTGTVLEQIVGKPEKSDNFSTYPYLQYAICLPRLKNLISRFIINSELNKKNPLTKESKLWYHPTLWEWIKLPK